MHTEQTLATLERDLYKQRVALDKEREELKEAWLALIDAEHHLRAKIKAEREEIDAARAALSMSTPSLADLRALDAAAVDASDKVHAAMREGRGTKELHAACDEAWQALVRACASVGVASICLRPVKVDELDRASFIPHVLSIKS